MMCGKDGVEYVFWDIGINKTYKYVDKFIADSVQKKSLS